jgi:hypothetical protein
LNGWCIFSMIRILKSGNIMLYVMCKIY